MHDGPCSVPWDALSLSCWHRTVFNSRRLSGSRQAPSSSQREVGHMSKAPAFTQDASPYIQICLSGGFDFTIAKWLVTAGLSAQLHHSAMLHYSHHVLLPYAGIAHTVESCLAAAEVLPLCRASNLLLCICRPRLLGQPQLGSRTEHPCYPGSTGMSSDAISNKPYFS